MPKPTPKSPPSPFSTKKRNRPVGWGSFLWVGFGALLLVIFGVFLYLSPLFDGLRQKQDDSTLALAQQTQTGDQQQVDFTFYDELPKQNFYSNPEGLSVQKNNEATTVAPSSPDLVIYAPNQNSKNSPATKPDNKGQATYILQIRSYTSADLADTKRAEVLLTGVDAIVSRKQNPQGGYIYQVISKPMSSKAEATRANQRLQNNGIDALIIEQKH